MNQILKPEVNQSTVQLQTDKSNSKISKLYKIQFIIFTSIASICLVVFFIRLYTINQKESLSKKLMSSYSISTIYANDTDYTAELMDSSTNTNENFISNPFVIGMLKIDKISLNYPILSTSNNDLLEISLCRFAGPMPNTPGNLCIAGHNYVDYKFFSRLHELEIDDKIKLYDLNGTMLEYTISRKYETQANDVSCTRQNTDGKKILTLLTCNNVNGKRLVLVANP